MVGSPPNSASPVRDPRGPLRGREPPSSARTEPEPAPVHLRHQSRIGAGSDRTSPSKPPGAGSRGRKEQPRNRRQPRRPERVPVAAEPEPAPRRQPHRVAYHLIERLIGFDRPTALLGAASSVSRLPSALGDGGPDRRFAPDLKPEQYSALVGSARRRWLPRIVRNGDGKDRNEPTRGSSRAHTA